MKITDTSEISPKYSEEESTEFWEEVRQLDGEGYATMYSLGVALQILENFVLAQLKIAQMEKDDNN